MLNIMNRSVGPDHPVFIVAELSANHGRSLEKAKALIAAAAQCGANAVKLQTYTPDTMTINSRRAPFVVGKGTVWEGRTLYDLYEEAFTPWEWHPVLQAEAEQYGLLCFSAPFDASAVDFLESLDMACYKVASFEIVDLPLLKKIAATGKPVILSTGMANLGEIDEAVRTLRQGGCTQLALLKCTSAYPAPLAEMNLRAIPQLAATFGVPAGLSDHSLGIAAPVAAVALGACIIEKHFTLARRDSGPDSAFSLEPVEFTAMVQAIRDTEKALGHAVLKMTEREQASRIFRRSLFVVQDVRAGERLTVENVRAIRPGHGLHTRYLAEVLQRRAACDIQRGTPLAWGLTGEPVI